MTISIKPTASGSTIEQDGSTILTVDGSGNISTPNTFTSTGAITGTGGIYLGGTASANLLDDYEEGTFTPVLFATTTSDFTYSSNYGIYTKIGNVVFVFINIVLTSKGTSSGNIQLSNLPFTIGNVLNGTSIQCGCAIPFFGSLGTSNSGIYANPQEDTTYCNLRKLSGTSGTGLSSMDTSDLSNTSEFRIQFNYLVS